MRALAREREGYRIKLLGTRSALLAYSTHMQTNSNTCPHERVADKQRKAGLLFRDPWLYQFLLCQNSTYGAFTFTFYWLEMELMVTSIQSFAGFLLIYE